MYIHDPGDRRGARLKFRFRTRSAARTRYMCMEGGKRIDSSLKSYLRKVINKKRRWMGLGTI